MKKIKLSPFVHKVKGKKNWLLADLLKGRIFQIIPEGDVEEFKKQLVEHDLAYETEGVVPFKFNVSLKTYIEKFKVRELQVRITGICDDVCHDCGRICACTRGRGNIGNDVLGRIIDQFKFIPVEQILITGGNPCVQWNIIDRIKNEMAADKYSVLFRGGVKKDDVNRMAQNEIELISRVNVASKVDREQMVTDPFAFFYNQEFNPCWGNKIAIDLDGSIKPCLWWNESLGNIKCDQIKDMIAAGDFEKYWKLKKDEIETCCMCEYRYNCFDCRVSALKETGDLKAKLPCCKYDPASGIWEKY